MTRITLALTCLTTLLGCAAGRSHNVALLTDFGTRDHYVAVLTANVLRVNPDARLVTITHEITPFNIMQGAFVLAEAVPEFSAQTVVLAVVDPGVGTARAPIVVVTNAGHILVGPDNGLFDPLIRRSGGAQAVYRITNSALMRPGGDSSTFHGRDIFAPVAGHLSRGVDPAAVGPLLKSWMPLEVPQPIRAGDTLTGTILHVDHYGNIFTNMPGRWLADAPRGAAFEVAVGDKRQACTRQHTYGEVAEGAFLVLVSASGNIEIAQNLGNAARTLNVSSGAALALRRAVIPGARSD